MKTVYGYNIKKRNVYQYNMHKIKGIAKYWQVLHCNNNRLLFLYLSKWIDACIFSFLTNRIIQNHPNQVTMIFRLLNCLSIKSISN